MIPMLLLFGKAGAGKDTAADLICDHVPGAVKLALADPMKRVVGELFGFSEEQLWGPSERRAESVSYERPDPIVAVSKVVREMPTLPLDWRDQSSSRARHAFVSWLDMVSARAAADGGKLTARYALQTFGTEFGRAVSDTLWVDRALDVASALLRGGHSYSRSSGTTLDPAANCPLVVVSDGRFRNEVLEWRARGGAAFKVEATDSATVAGGATGHRSELEQDGVPDWWFDAAVLNDKYSGNTPEFPGASRAELACKLKDCLNRTFGAFDAKWPKVAVKPWF